MASILSLTIFLFPLFLIQCGLMTLDINCIFWAKPSAAFISFCAAVKQWSFTGIISHLHLFFALVYQHFFIFLALLINYCLWLMCSVDALSKAPMVVNSLVDSLLLSVKQVPIILGCIFTDFIAHESFTREMQLCQPMWQLNSDLKNGKHTSELCCSKAIILKEREKISSTITLPAETVWVTKPCFFHYQQNQSQAVGQWGVFFIYLLLCFICPH